VRKEEEETPTPLDQRSDHFGYYVNVGNGIVIMEPHNNNNNNNNNNY